MIDFYELLGISMDSTKQEIKTAYREMVKKYHPDVNKSEDSNKIIRSLNEAKEVLLDDEKRKEYDKLLNDGNYYLHKFTINDDNGIIEKNSTLIPLRYMSGNDNLSKKDIDEMLKYISMIAQEVKNNDK